MRAYRVVITVEEFDDAKPDEEIGVLDLPYKAYETYDQKRAVDVLYSVIETYRDTFTHISA